jgi:chromosome segregation protein
LYRGRREESLTRLDTTRRNLERVLDILSELEPRLGSLEKQARRAQEYERIRADLRLLLRDWYGYHWHRTQQEVLRAREVLHTQETRLERTRERQSEVEVQLSDLRGKLQEIRGDLNTWHSSSAGLHTQWEKVSRSLAVMDERQRAMLAQQQNLHNEISRMEEEQKARRERLQDLVEERDRLQMDLEEAEAQVVAARKDLDKRQAERARVEQSVRDTRRTLVQSETAQVQLKAHQNELSNRADSLFKNQQSLEQALAKDAQLLDEAQKRLEKQVGLRQQAEQEQKQAEEALQIHRKALSELETRRKLLQDERSRFEGERTRLSTQLEVLEQAERSLSGLANGARFVLQEARQGRLKGRYQALSTQLVVPAVYETAIAAALGEHLDGILIESGTDPEDALKLLSRAEKGRAVLLPVDWTRPQEQLDIQPQDDGFVGVAAELVQAPETLQPVLCLLLGQVLVVRDRDAARRYAAHLPATARAVTLQGEVFFGTGVVVAGPENRSSTIGRPRRIQELQADLAGADQKLQAVKQRLQETETELNQQRGRERDLENTLRQSGQALSQINQAYQRAVLDVEQVRQRHEFQSRQLSGLKGQIERVEQELKQGQAEMEKTGKKVAELNEQIREFNRSLARLPLEELQAQVVHWNTSVAVAARALKDAERRLSEHRESIASAQRQKDTINQRLNENTAGLAQLETEKNSLREQEINLNNQIDALRVLIEPAEELLHGIEQEYRDSDGANRGTAGGDDRRAACDPGSA